MNGNSIKLAQIETARKRGDAAAKELVLPRKPFIKIRPRYAIISNPYPRHMKHEHVAWHNAFYQARKEMGVGVGGCTV